MLHAIPLLTSWQIQDFPKAFTFSDCQQSLASQVPVSISKMLPLNPMIFTYFWQTDQRIHSSHFQIRKRALVLQASCSNPHRKIPNTLMLPAFTACLHCPLYLHESWKEGFPTKQCSPALHGYIFKTRGQIIILLILLLCHSSENPWFIHSWAVWLWFDKSYLNLQKLTRDTDQEMEMSNIRNK